MGVIEEEQNRTDTTDLNWCFEFQEVGLFQEDILGDKTELLDLCLRKLHLLPGSASDIKQPIDDTIENPTFHSSSSEVFQKSRACAKGQRNGVGWWFAMITLGKYSNRERTNFKSNKETLLLVLASWT